MAYDRLMAYDHDHFDQRLKLQRSRGSGHSHGQWP